MPPYTNGTFTTNTLNYTLDTDYLANYAPVTWNTVNIDPNVSESMLEAKLNEFKRKIYDLLVELKKIDISEEEFDKLFEEI